MFGGCALNHGLKKVRAQWLCTVCDTYVGRGLVLLSGELAPRPARLSAPSFPKLLASLDPLEGGRVGSGS